MLKITDYVIGNPINNVYIAHPYMSQVFFL